MKTRYCTHICAAALIAATFMSCSASDPEYDYYDNSNTGDSYYNSHDEPPKATLPGKIIFDGIFPAFKSLPEVARDIIAFNEYLLQPIGPKRDSIANKLMPSSSINFYNNVWLITAADNRWLFDTPADRPISQSGAEWKLACRKEKMIYIPENKCTVKFVEPHKFALDIELMKCTNDFQAEYEVEIEWKENLLNTSSPYSFVITGKGCFRSIADEDFTIDFTIKEPMSTIDTSLYDPVYNRLFNGSMDMTIHAPSADDKMSVTLSSSNTLTITYNGTTDIWK